MKGVTKSDTESIVVIEDAEIVVDTAPTQTRRAGDVPPSSTFADDPFVVDWAPPQS